MTHKRTYQKPTFKVVEMNTSVALLQNSATLQGYQHQENTADDGWSDE